MEIVGLTGGIACGKSTVAGFFRELGVPVIDADEVAREVVAPGSEALEEIVTAFGDELLAADGSLDRKALGARVFSDSQARQVLNVIMHPQRRRAGNAGHPARDHHAYRCTRQRFVENKLHANLWRSRRRRPRGGTVERLMARDGMTLRRRD